MSNNNDFRLAFAGIVATATVGVWSAHLAYQASSNQMHAENDRAAVQFAKEQRKTAYVDYLQAEEDVHNTAFRLCLFMDAYNHGRVEFSVLETAWNAWGEAGVKDLRADSEVKLLASQPVAALIKKWDDYDDSVSDQLVAVRDTLGTDGPTKDAAIEKLRGMVGADNEPSLDEFVKVAKADLGLAKD